MGIFDGLKRLYNQLVGEKSVTEKPVITEEPVRRENLPTPESTTPRQPASTRFDDWSVPETPPVAAERWNYDAQTDAYYLSEPSPRVISEVVSEGGGVGENKNYAIVSAYDAPALFSEIQDSIRQLPAVTKMENMAHQNGYRSLEHYAAAQLEFTEDKTVRVGRFTTSSLSDASRQDIRYALEEKGSLVRGGFGEYIVNSDELRSAIKQKQGIEYVKETEANRACQPRTASVTRSEPVAPSSQLSYAIEGIRNAVNAAGNSHQSSPQNASSPTRQGAVRG